MSILKRLIKSYVLNKILALIITTKINKQSIFRIAIGHVDSWLFYFFCICYKSFNVVEIKLNCFSF